MRRIKPHTAHKLEYIKKYIDAYLVATKRLGNRYYIDAFAGTGKCLLCDKFCTSLGGKKCVDCSKGKIIDGSVLISLNSKNTFEKYLFIEKEKKYIEEMEKIISENFSDDLIKRIEVKQGDSNILLNDDFVHSVGYYTGCLILLDPEGPELLWETIKTLSYLKKADLLILYPYDMALVRMTKENKYKEKLDNFFGFPEWQDICSDKKLIPEEKKQKILDLYIGNLKKIGFEYVTYRQIRRNLRRGNPLYHLILATHNPTGIKIMKDIFDKELDGQTKMKLK